MNIMAQAHKDTRSYMAQQATMQVAQKSYKVVFAAMLVNCHAHYKFKVAKAVSLKDAVYKALVSNDEGGGQVYLDNAFSEVAHLMNRHQWAGYLSALNLEGKYQPQGDKEFGLVL